MTDQTDAVAALCADAYGRMTAGGCDPVTAMVNTLATGSWTPSVHDARHAIIAWNKAVAVGGTRREAMRAALDAVPVPGPSVTAAQVAGRLAEHLGRGVDVLVGDGRPRDGLDAGEVSALEIDSIEVGPGSSVLLVLLDGTEVSLRVETSRPGHATRRQVDL
jgi:hypothetical protein